MIQIVSAIFNSNKHLEMIRCSPFILKRIVQSSSNRFVHHETQPKNTPFSIENTSNFDFKSRSQHLCEIKKKNDFDVVIIGGGITGAAVLLDCSRKGLKAVLVESNDFSSGSSSKSTKLIHGGLRYLENAFKLGNENRKEDFKLVNEALIERNLLINTAPHLVDKIGIVIPTKKLHQALFYFIGSLFYENFEKVYSLWFPSKTIFTDKLKFKFPLPKLMFKKELNKLFPNLSNEYNFGILMWDGQIDDCKMVVEAILTATSLRDENLLQNNAVNYVEVTDFIKNSDGEIIAANLFDKITSESFCLKSKIFVNATGVMSDRIRNMANPLLNRKILASKGDHLTIDNSNGEFLDTKTAKVGLLIPKTNDGRLMFVLPWKSSIIAGTTDSFVHNYSTECFADQSSVDQIIKNLNEFYPGQKIKIESQWSGLRPLVYDSELPRVVKNTDKNYFSKSTKNGNNDSNHFSNILTKDIKRSHVVESDEKSGLISIMGGKFTIFRLMGEDCANRVLSRLKQKHSFPENEYEKSIKKSTRNFRFIGDFRNKLFQLDENNHNCIEHSSISNREDFLDCLKVHIKKSVPNISDDVLEHLVASYGQRAILIARKFTEKVEQSYKVDEKYPITAGEISHICESEMIVNLVDLVTNRLRLAFENIAEAERMIPLFANVFGDFNGWDKDRKKKEVELNLEKLRKLNF